MELILQGRLKSFQINSILEEYFTIKQPCLPRESLRYIFLIETSKTCLLHEGLTVQCIKYQYLWYVIDVTDSNIILAQIVCNNCYELNVRVEWYATKCPSSENEWE